MGLFSTSTANIDGRVQVKSRNTRTVYFRGLVSDTSTYIVEGCPIVIGRHYTIAPVPFKQSYIFWGNGSHTYTKSRWHNHEQTKLRIRFMEHTVFLSHWLRHISKAWINQGVHLMIKMSSYHCRNTSYKHNKYGLNNVLTFIRKSPSVVFILQPSSCATDDDDQWHIIALPRAKSRLR